GLPFFRRVLKRRNMMAADYRQIRGGGNRVGRHYSRFPLCKRQQTLVPLIPGSQKSSNKRSNRRSQAKFSEVHPHLPSDILPVLPSRPELRWFWAFRAIRPSRANRGNTRSHERQDETPWRYV